MSNNALFTAGRILMSAVFLVGGMRKWLSYVATLETFRSLGIPVPDIVLPATIVLELGGAAALIVGWRTMWVAGVLGLFCIATAMLAHRFWAVDPAQFGNQLSHFLKNVAMAGGFLIVALSSVRMQSKDRS